MSSFADGRYKVEDKGSGGWIVFYVSKEGFKVYDGKDGVEVCYYLEMTAERLGESQWLPEYRYVGGMKEELGHGLGWSSTIPLQDLLLPSPWDSGFLGAIKNFL